MKKLCNVDDITEGKGIVVDLDEDKQLALFKSNGDVFAIDNACPHQDGPLGEGTLEDGNVVCPWHGWCFDLKSGACQNRPGEDAKVHPIAVKDGEVFYDG